MLFSDTWVSPWPTICHIYSLPDLGHGDVIRRFLSNDWSSDDVCLLFLVSQPPYTLAKSTQLIQKDLAPMIGSMALILYLKTYSATRTITLAVDSDKAGLSSCRSPSKQRPRFPRVLTICEYASHQSDCSIIDRRRCGLANR
jgi:hypothetical protein